MQQDSFEKLEKLIAGLNEKLRLKDEYKNTLRRLDRVDNALARLNARFAEMDNGLFCKVTVQQKTRQIIK